MSNIDIMYHVKFENGYQEIMRNSEKLVRLFF